MNLRLITAHFLPNLPHLIVLSPVDDQVTPFVGNYFHDANVHLSLYMRR